MNEYPATSRPRRLITIITIALFLGVGALVLSVQNAVGLDRQDEEREDERIASDLTACERGNELRRQIRDIGESQEDLLEGVLGEVYVFVTGGDPDELAELEPLRAALAPLFAGHARAVAQIELTDCKTVVPGA